MSNFKKYLEALNNSGDKNQSAIIGNLSNMSGKDPKDIKNWLNGIINTIEDHIEKANLEIHRVVNDDFEEFISECEGGDEEEIIDDLWQCLYDHDWSTAVLGGQY